MTRLCHTCGVAAEMTPFSNETHQIVFRGTTRDVEGLSGIRCNVCGEVEYDQQSAERYASAGDSLVLAARLADGEELRRIRKRLRMNQSEAAAFTGGGHNAFSRYETGKVPAPPAVINLFRLLDRHPEDIKSLKRA